MLNLKFKKLNPKAVIPVYAKSGDAGFDLYSTEEYTLQPGERHIFNVGLASEIPEGYFVLFRPKSGLASKAGIDVLAGVIDAGYRGEWGVILLNTGEEAYSFHPGDKIAQGILLPVNPVQITEVSELSETERGTGGFGSTGK